MLRIAVEVAVIVHAYPVDARGAGIVFHRTGLAGLEVNKRIRAVGILFIVFAVFAYQHPAPVGE